MATKKKTGRPLKKIDWEKAEKLANIFCTGEEIASILGMDYDTLNSAIKREYDKSFSDWYKKHSADGKISLRRTQFKLATEENNVTMAIWMGKQYLGQSDKIESHDTLEVKEVAELEFLPYDEDES